jgi:hypothetical protein
VVGIRVIVYWKVQANICVQVCCLLHASWFVPRHSAPPPNRSACHQNRELLRATRRRGGTSAAREEQRRLGGGRRPAAARTPLRILPTCVHEVLISFVSIITY